MSTIIELLVCLAALNFTITGIENYIKVYNFREENPIKTGLNVFSAICAILLFFLHLNSILDRLDNNNNNNKTYENSRETIKSQALREFKQGFFKKFKATYYQAVQGQCDDDPLTTASGYRINVRKVKSGETKIVAVSRDLLKEYPYGSTIYVHQPVHLRGCYKVEDTMNKRFTNRIDFLVHDKIVVDSVYIL